jgi:hypothetical protein
MGLVAYVSAYRVPAEVDRSGSQLFVRSFAARRDAYSSREDVVILAHWGQNSNAVAAMTMSREGCLAARAASRAV